MLMLIPVTAAAGTAYELAVRPVDDSDIARSSAANSAVVTRYFVDDGKVRVGGAEARRTYLFEDRTLYAVDHQARTVHVLTHATLEQSASHYRDAVKHLEESAASAPPDDRAAAEQKALDLKAASERLLQPVARDYRVTSRFESVDGRACRVWEEREAGAKRLELCVAPTATLPGAAEILQGMKTMSRFRQGSEVALGVDFGLSEWWPDIAKLGGLPLLIREYKYDSLVSEVMLTTARAGVAPGSQLHLPEDYQRQDGPDYSQWYVR